MIYFKYVFQLFVFQYCTTLAGGEVRFLHVVIGDCRLYDYVCDLHYAVHYVKLRYWRGG